MNWKSIIQDLTRRGYTQAFIAKKAGVSQPTIAALALGQQQDMRWKNGNRLVEFHKEETAKSSLALVTVQKMEG